MTVAVLDMRRFNGRTPKTTGAELVGVFEHLSPEWHAARRYGLGGSEIAAVLGLSKWESHFSLWLRKAGRIGEQPENDEMRAGTLFEPVILDHFESVHPELHVTRKVGTWRNIERPWQVANPDGLADDDAGTAPQLAVVEVKFALYTDEWGKAGADEIPPYYLAQCRWYLDVFGYDLCYVHVFFGSCAEFRTYIVRPDEADTTLMRTAAAAFIESLRTKRRPSIDGHDATYDAVRRLHPDIDDERVEIPLTMARQYVRALIRHEKATAAKRKAVSRLMDRLGSGRRAYCQDRQIAMRIPGQGDSPPFLRPVNGLTKQEQL